jgi:proteic killer suppression protein
LILEASFVDVRFSEPKLDRMESESAFTAGLSPAVLSAYRGRIQALRAAPREQALQQLHSFEVRGREHGKHALRVTNEWDLHVAFEDENGARIAVVEALVQRTTTKTERSS